MPLADLATGPGAYVFAFVLGALLGSFANVCILRIPRSESIVVPGSHCGSCKTPIRWYDNFPIVSYFVLRGRCRACGATFSPRYMLVEATTALLVLFTYHEALVVLHPADEIPIRLARFGVYALFVFVLVVITFIDLDHKKIPDKITYPGIPVFFAFGILLGDQPILDLAIGVAGGYLIVRLISDGYYYLTKREGLGYGDGKLLALVGGLLGWRAVLFALFGGSLLGTLVALPILALRRRGDDSSLRHMELPFGPFLAGGALIYLYLEPTIRVGLGLL